MLSSPSTSIFPSKTLSTSALRIPFSAIRNGDISKVKRFLDEGCDTHATGGRFHGTFLMETCRFQNTEIVDMLIERGAEVNTSGGGLWTPLHYACDGLRDMPEIVQALLRYGAELEPKDHHDRTPLHLACKRGSVQVALTLLKAGANANEADLDGRTPVHYAASKDRTEVMSKLLEFGGNVSACDRERESPLHKATRAKHSVMMNLLQRAGAEPGAVNCWGEQALTLAPAYKMESPPPRHDHNSKLGADSLRRHPCVACSGKRGRHYYFCRKDFLDDLPNNLILGSNGRPFVKS